MAKRVASKKKEESSEPKMLTKEQRQKKLLAHINKQQSGKNKNTTTDVHMATELPDEDVIKTGYPFFDWFLNGGWRRGRHHMIYGAPSAGKTTFLLGSAKAMIENDYIVQYHDVEDFLTKEYLEYRGVDTSMFVWSPEKSATKILNTIIDFTQNGLSDVVIVDSLPAMALPTDIGENGKTKYIGESTVAKLASLLTDYLRKISTYMRSSKLATIYINQIRSRGVGGSEDYDPMFFRDGVSIPGGKALIHWTALSIFIKRAAKSRIRDYSVFSEKDVASGTNMVTGFPVEIGIRKSKITGVREFTSINMEYYHDTGFNDRTSMVEYMYKMNLIKILSGSYFEFEYDGFSMKEHGFNAVRERVCADNQMYEAMLRYLWDNRKQILSVSHISQDALDAMIVTDDGTNEDLSTVIADKSIITETDDDEELNGSDDMDGDSYSVASDTDIDID
jgi:RecA/RadA recombinase